MSANRKPILILKRTDQIGGLHKLEVFHPFSNTFVLHRHSLVENKELSKILGFKRNFKNKYYCMQEIVVFETEALQLIKALQAIDFS